MSNQALDPSLPPCTHGQMLRLVQVPSSHSFFDTNDPMYDTMHTTSLHYRRQFLFSSSSSSCCCVVWCCGLREVACRDMPSYAGRDAVQHYLRSLLILASYCSLRRNIASRRLYLAHSAVNLIYAHRPAARSLRFSGPKAPGAVALSSCDLNQCSSNQV